MTPPPTTDKFKGTPGPWTAKHGELASGIFAASNKSQIISCDQFTGWLDAAECRANANAAAAVPDMIEALIKAQRTIHITLRKYREGAWGELGQRSSISCLEERLGEIESALSKALGQFKGTME